MIEGLQTLEKVERLIESVDFLSSQSNMLAASKQFQKLKELVMGPNTDVK